MLLGKSRYTPSGAVVASANNQIIEGLDIVAASGSVAVDLNGKTGVTVRKNRIRHLGARGIVIPSGSTGATISDNDIIYNDDGRASLANENWQPIFCQANGTQILRNRTQNGNGIKLQGCDSVLIQYLEQRNSRGTSAVNGFGGGIAFDTCTNCSLLDFYMHNDLSVAWVGDCFNAFNGSGHTIARGLIDGNNCTVGAMVQLQSTTGCSVTDVDAINWCNQGFSTYDAATCSFLRCNAGYNYKPCTQGRGNSSAGTPPAFANQAPRDASNSFTSCGYYDPVSPSMSYYNEGSDAGHDITLASLFTPRTPYLWVPAYV